MKKTVHINEGQRAIVYDSEKNNARLLATTPTGIDWMYIIPEDCEVRYKNAQGMTVVKQASKNDILIQFYGNKTTQHICTIVKNAEWKQNIIAKQAEDAAKDVLLANSPSPCCCDCDCERSL